jgi:cyclopropane fatty-acyl-phospholipid synthase-like methyltransferase
MQVSPEHIKDYYVNWSKLVVNRIEELKQLKPSRTYSDYWSIDTLNVVGVNAVRNFISNYNPGPNVVDIGAGVGGTCRVLAAEYGCNPVGIEFVPELV